MLLHRDDLMSMIMLMVMLTRALGSNSGDAHVAQATALVSLGNFQVLADSNNYTATISTPIQPYWVMWVLSVLDYYDASADVSLLKLLAP